jgi:hypothetical protein
MPTTKKRRFRKDRIHRGVQCGGFFWIGFRQDEDFGAGALLGAMQARDGLAFFGFGTLAKPAVATAGLSVCF